MLPTGKRVLIIQKNGEYLVGVPYSDTTFLRWSTSPYDAYRMDRRRIAKRIAERVGGNVVEFCPITGNVRQVGDPA